MAALPQSVLEAVGQVEGVLVYYKYNTPYIPICLTDAMDSMPYIIDRDVDLVLNACLQHLRLDRPLDYVCLLALRYNRVDALLHTAPSLVPEPLSKLWSQAFTCLATQNRWSCVRTLIGRSTQAECLALFQWMTRTSLQDNQAFTVFETLVARCSEAQRMCLKEIVSTVVELGCVDQFKVLVYSKNNTIRQLILDNLSNLVKKTCHERLLNYNFSNEAADHNGCLAVACEAGLLTAATTDQSSSRAPYTPFGHAVCYNQPDLVHFLYYGGATCEGQPFSVCRNTYLKRRAKDAVDPASVPQSPPPLKGFPSMFDVDVAQTIQGFLSNVASNPRPLTTLCLHQVSRHLGWGHGREGKIEQLKIPGKLKEGLKFRDLKRLLKNKSQ